jgi:hypothetical protein
LRDEKLADLRRLSFGAFPADLGGRGSSSIEGPVTLTPAAQGAAAAGAPAGPSVSGDLSSEAGIRVAWKYLPPAGPADAIWVIVLDRDESLDAKPAWAASFPASAGVLMVAPRGTGPTRWDDPAPYTIRRSLALLGETADGGRVVDVVAALLDLERLAQGRPIKVAGRGQAGVIAAYAALLAPEPLVKEALLVDPPATHREGPIFLNVLRVLDVPDALGLLAPRPLRILTGKKEAFERTAKMYAAVGGKLELGDLSP